MSRPNFDRLAPPPRSLPLGLRALALFGPPLGLAGWVLLAFTSPFVWAFVLNADLLSPVLFRGDVDRVEGRVTSARETGASEGDVPVHAVGYSYRGPDGADLDGVSYVTGGPPAVGAAVTVEYLTLRPLTSRIQGMRSATFGPGAGFVVIFPALGALLAGLGLRSGLRRLRLLRSGQAGAAEFVSQEGTSMEINDRPVFRLIFEFAGTDGLRHRVSQTTTDPQGLRDERRETVLFHPENPDHAVLVDSLPAAVVADEQGQLAARGAAGLALLLPLLTVLGNASCAAYRFLR
ncbi:MAG TPA: DUF3592 domain-containing protein [Vicinamibacteria bacterium]|nr:DUF3592 domain-containing protein [Vicinamibacteria bacterium]